jgi:hypothetical protein
MRKFGKASSAIGRKAFAKISAVEGIEPNDALEADFRRFDKQKLAPAERRKILLRKYGNRA